MKSNDWPDKSWSETNIKNSKILKMKLIVILNQ